VWLRRFSVATSWLRAHARSITVGTLVLAVALGALAARLELRVDLAELLPADHPAVVALRTVTPRQRSAGSLVVLVDSGDALRSAAFVDALRPALQALVPDTLTSIDWGPDPEPSRFYDRFGWLYASVADLEEVEGLADAIVTRRTSPLYVDLDGEDPEAQLDRLEHRLDDKRPRTATTKRFQSDDGRIIGIRLWRKRVGLGDEGDHAALLRVREAVARIGPARFGRDLRVRYTGPIAQAIEEQSAIRDDLSIATLACAALVLGALYLAFGSMRFVLLALWPTALGVLGALAVAALTLGALNLNTAFLVSIILGNGINAPIMLLAELRRLRESRSWRTALPRAMLRSFRGVSAAMLATAASYAALAATRFRGFRQFGLIGGVGMLAVLVATYLALPAAIVCVESRLRSGRDRLSPPLLRILSRVTPARARFLAVMLCLVSIGGVVRFARGPIEWDLKELRSTESEAGALWDTMEDLGMGAVGAGYIANTAVMWVEDPSQTARIADALRAHDAAGDRLIATVRTLDSLLPTDQAAKLVALARVRRRIDKLIARHGDVLSDREKQRLRDARPPDDLREVTIDDLPSALREAFTEVDGTRGRLIGIDADGRRYRDWEGHALLALSRALTVEVSGHTYVAASAATVFSGMLRTLIDDAPRIAAYAMAGVTVVCALAFRAAAPLVLGTLAMGLWWLVGIAGALGLRLNFMSFAAVPISIGVGADYAANIWSRPTPRGQLPAAAATVVLCSLTTVIGYSTLLLGHNGALRSFGLLCDLGEAACLLAALLAPLCLRGTR
jgi:predicted RND superfamily exporter protein